MSNHEEKKEEHEKKKLALELGEAHIALAKASGDIKKLYRKLDELEKSDTKPK